MVPRIQEQAPTDMRSGASETIVFRPPAIVRFCYPDRHLSILTPPVLLSQDPATSSHSFCGRSQLLKALIIHTVTTRTELEHVVWNKNTTVSEIPIVGADPVIQGCEDALTVRIDIPSFYLGLRNTVMSGDLNRLGASHVNANHICPPRPAVHPPSLSSTSVEIRWEWLQQPFFQGQSWTTSGAVAAVRGDKMIHIRESEGSKRLSAIYPVPNLHSERFNHLLYISMSANPRHGVSQR